LRLKVKAFGHRTSLEMEHRFITLNCRLKDLNWNGIIQIICCIRSLRLTLQRGKFMSTVFMGGCRSVVKPWTQTKTLQKHFRRVQPDRLVAVTFLQPDSTWPYTSLKTGSVLPHPPYSPELFVSDFHPFEAF
jgi:hypothetical protein